MGWDEKSIIIYVEDLLLNELELKQAYNHDGTYPFRLSHYLPPNLAVGDPTATGFPVRFEAGYVLVYQESIYSTLLTFNK